MTFSFVARLLLAAAFLLATQLALVHPLQHAGTAAFAQRAVHEQHPADLLHARTCDVCVAAAALGTGVSSARSAEAVPVPGFPPGRKPQHSFVAAFTPLFHSHAPPVPSMT